MRQLQSSKKKITALGTFFAKTQPQRMPSFRREHRVKPRNYSLANSGPQHPKNLSYRLLLADYLRNMHPLTFCNRLKAYRQEFIYFYRRHNPATRPDDIGSGIHS